MAWIKRKAKNPTRRQESRREARNEVYQSASWRRLRALKMRESPLCEMCMERGEITGAVDVHHIVSFTDAGSLEERDRLAYDYDNLMSLCKVCHNRIHHGGKGDC